MYGRGIFVNQNGTWVEVKNPQVKQGSTWVPIKKGFTNINGVWTQFWPSTGSMSYSSVGSYTFTVPYGIYTLNISAAGGGGGGGGTDSPYGGSAGYPGRYIVGSISVNPNDTITIGVGGGGQHGNSGTGTGDGTGGISSVGYSGGRGGLPGQAGWSGGGGGGGAATGIVVNGNPAAVAAGGGGGGGGGHNSPGRGQYFPGYGSFGKIAGQQGEDKSDANVISPYTGDGDWSGTGPEPGEEYENYGTTFIADGGGGGGGGGGYFGGLGGLIYGGDDGAYAGQTGGCYPNVGFTATDDPLGYGGQPAQQSGFVGTPGSNGYATISW